MVGLSFGLLVGLAFGLFYFMVGLAFGLLVGLTLASFTFIIGLTFGLLVGLALASFTFLGLVVVLNSGPQIAIQPERSVPSIRQLSAPLLLHGQLAVGQAVLAIQVFSLVVTGLLIPDAVS